MPSILSRFARGAWVVLALSTLASAYAGAQREPASLPDTILPTTAATPVPAYLGQIGTLPAPYFVSDGRFLALLAAAPSAARLDAVRADSGNSPRCPGLRAPLMAAQSETESVALGGGKYFVVVVLAAEAPRAWCELQWSLTSRSIWRAMRLSQSSSAAGSEPRAMQLELDGQRMEPAVALRRPAYVLVDGRWNRAGSQLRYYYDMSLLAPREGRPREIALRIWGDRGAPASIDIQSAATRRLAFEFIAWEMARGPAAAPANLALRPARRLSPAVQHMVDSARTDLSVAGAQAAAWTTSYANGEDRESDAAIARVVLAEALLARGEPALATAAVSDLRRSHPCLMAPEGISPALARLVQPTKADDRCTPIDVKRVTMASIVPGLGEVMARRPLAGFISAGWIGALLANAITSDAKARDRYAAYQSSVSGENADALYGDARSLRTQARIEASIAAGFWLFDAMMARHSAKQHNSEIENDRF